MEHVHDCPSCHRYTVCTDDDCDAEPETECWVCLRAQVARLTAERDSERNGRHEALAAYRRMEHRLGLEIEDARHRAGVLKANLDQARKEVAAMETALKLEQWEISHPWSVSEGGDQVTDPHVVRNLWEASERELRARAEAAEAEVRRMRLECHRIGGDESWGAESEVVGATMRLMAARVLDAGDIGKSALTGEKGGA